MINFVDGPLDGSLRVAVGLEAADDDASAFLDLWCAGSVPCCTPDLILQDIEEEGARMMRAPGDDRAGVGGLGV